MTLPTVVFDSGRTPVNGGRTHIPLPSAAVSTGGTVVVQTLCGLMGTGRVKLRRGANCGECLAKYSELGLD